MFGGWSAMIIPSTGSEDVGSIPGAGRPTLPEIETKKVVKRLQRDFKLSFGILTY